MKDVTIYHNPKCSKSRETLNLLREQGIEPAIVEYLKEPPSKKRILELANMLGGDAHTLLRTKEPAFRESGLTPESTNAEIADAIVREPVLLERPIVVRGSRAAIGRPPEKVLEILR